MNTNKHYVYVLVPQIGVSLALIVCAFLFLNASAETSNYKYSDTSVKSAYIANIVGFVSIKKGESLTTPNSLCIVGDDLIGITLAQIINGRDKDGKMQIIKLDHHSSFKPCDLVFIGQNRKDYVRSILYKTKKLAALTISDIEGFNNMGGMVEFIQLENRIKLGINRNAAQSVGIKFSSKLLNIAHEVY